MPFPGAYDAVFVLFLLFIAVGWIISILFFWIGRRWKARTFYTLGLSGIVVLTLVTLPTAAYNGYTYYRSHSPRCIYQDIFREGPTPDVHFISGIHLSSADSDSVDLSFKASHSTFQHLLQKSFNGLPQSSLKELQEDHRGLGSSLDLKPDSEIYFLEESNGLTVFSYDPTSGIAILHTDYY